MFSLESPHRGDSNDYTQYTIFNIKRKIDLNYLKSAAMGFFPGTQARVRNSQGKRAISVRAIEVLLYINKLLRLIRVLAVHTSPTIPFSSDDSIYLP